MAAQVAATGGVALGINGLTRLFCASAAPEALPAVPVQEHILLDPDVTDHLEWFILAHLRV
jgi:hypothetical protein